MQLTDDVTTEATCEECGRPVLRTITAKNRKEIVLEAEPFAARKILKRFHLTDRGATYVDIHSQEAGESGFPFHVCQPKMTLAEALAADPELEKLMLAARSAAMARDYDADDHAAKKDAYNARLKEMGVEFGSPRTLGFGANVPGVGDVPDPTLPRWGDES